MNHELWITGTFIRAYPRYRAQFHTHSHTSKKCRDVKTHVVFRVRNTFFCLCIGENTRVHRGNPQNMIRTCKFRVKARIESPTSRGCASNMLITAPWNLEPAYTCKLGKFIEFLYLVCVYSQLHCA